MTRFAFVLLMLVPLLFVPKSVGEGTLNLNRTLKAQKQLISERPYDTELHNDLGNLLVLAGRHEEAESAYGRALELDPTSTSAQFNLGLLLQQDGRSEEALKAFEAVMVEDSGHAWATYQAGVVLHERGKRKAALEHYARAFALDASLTFAQTNPHIIDNRLATEALLLSEKFTAPTATRMPRLYGEPERIVDLMLKMEAPENSEEPAEDDEDDAPKSQGRGGNHRPLALEQSEGGEQAVGQERRGAGDEEDDEDEEDRSALSESVQVVGGLAGSAGTAGNKDKASGKRAKGRRGGAPERGAAATGGGARRGGAEGGKLQKQTPNRSRYRPATTSTGRLELELLPEEEEPERVTR